MTYKLTENDEDKIVELLEGRRVVKVDDETLRLDDGTVLRLRGHEGGCICGAGDYDLKVLNGIDNVITRVEVRASPSGDDLDGEGYYQIFVFAGHAAISLAEFVGSDGNGYYGTGFTIEVTPA